MHDFMDLSCLTSGYLEVSNGVDTVRTRNLVTYTGGDLIAQLLAGNVQYRITYMGFEYQNTAGTPAPPAAARTDTTATILTPLTGTFDYLRGGLSSTPFFTAGDANHNYNQVHFTALSVATTGVHGVAFGAGSNSKIYAVTLLASPTGVATGDVIYARAILGTVLPAVGAGQVSGAWIAEAR